jgi:hypothetical protein
MIIIGRGDLPGPLEHSHRAACSSRLGCNLVALRTAEFRDSLAVGVIALVIVAILVWWRSRDARRWFEPVEWGWLAVLGVISALDLTGHLLPSTALGLALLLIAGAVTQRWRLSTVWLAALMLPGAVVIGAALALRQILPAWANAAVILGTVIGGCTGATLDRHRESRGYAPLLFAVSSAGLYATVPDTDFALILAGVLLPMGLLCLPRYRMITGAAGAAGLSGCVCVVAAIGGYGRPSAIVGGIACLGVVALAPALAKLASSVKAGRRELMPSLVIAIHVVLVWYAARIAGRQPFARRALVVWAVGEIVVVAAVTTVLRRRTVASR